MNVQLSLCYIEWAFLGQGRFVALVTRLESYRLYFLVFGPCWRQMPVFHPMIQWRGWKALSRKHVTKYPRNLRKAVDSFRIKLERIIQARGNILIKLFTNVVTTLGYTLLKLHEILFAIYRNITLYSSPRISVVPCRKTKILNKNKSKMFELALFLSDQQNICMWMQFFILLEM